MSENLNYPVQNILLIGNPNVGKTTLFNSLTKAHEHTGNFHGVTVEKAKRIVNFNNKKFCFYDLPGLYSMVDFSAEEMVSKNAILNIEATRLVVVDANSLRRNLYLCLQLKEIGLDFKILINNYKYFSKHGGQIDVEKLISKLNIDAEITNAKKQKFNLNLIKFQKNIKKSENNLKYLNFFVEKITNNLKISNNQAILALNGVFDGLNTYQIDYIKQFYTQIIAERYRYIDELLHDCQKINNSFIYGKNKLDKLILNPFFMVFSFIFLFFSVFYLIFFLIGPILSDFLINLFNVVFINPFLNILTMITDNIWIIEFFSSGVLSSLSTILSFLPQICLMYMVLTILEDSGLIARLCYVVDDFLTPFGLNGKLIYTMLMGLGCNTLATLTTRNIKGKNLKIKSALLNPYISCMARLPIYSIVATAIFGIKSFWIVLGIYLLGIAVSLIMAVVLNKTILPTSQSELLLEFPPLKHIDIKHCFETIIMSAVDMFKRLFSVVLVVGVIVWIATHTQFNLYYTQDITNSMAYLIADKIAFLFAPIGLNSAGLITALFVGVLAKELVVSTMSICNNTLTRTDLISSLLIATNIIHFNKATAVSFIIFSSLYCPCASNMAVLKAETGRFYSWFAFVSQFVVAYMLAFISYTCMTVGILFAVVEILVIVIILFSILHTIKKVKHKKCLTCHKCRH